MVKKCIKFDRLGPVFNQTQEIANLDPKFEFGSGVQKWSKNVLNSFVWDEFLVKPKCCKLGPKIRICKMVPRNGQKMY